MWPFGRFSGAGSKAEAAKTAGVLFPLTPGLSPDGERESERRVRERHNQPLGSKLGIDATKKLLGEGCKRLWPPLIKMDAAVRNGIHSLFAEEA